MLAHPAEALKLSGSVVTIGAFDGVHRDHQALIIATSLVQATGSAYSIPTYLLGVAVISLISILLISETRLTDIEELGSKERALNRRSREGHVDDARR